MDYIVKQAMVKWPNVPHCYGWLGLDARGDWYMRDDRTQALGAFASGVPGSKGSRLLHEKLIEFIQRNYDVDEAGCWYFQNGPQRVYVELEVAPHVWRVQAGDGAHATVQNQGGASADVLQCMLDAEGRLYLQTTLGFGLVHTQDVLAASDLIEAGAWQPQDVVASTLPERFHFVPSPQAQKANPKADPKAS